MQQVLIPGKTRVRLKTRKGVVIWTILFYMEQDQKRGLGVGKGVEKGVKWFFWGQDQLWPAVSRAEHETAGKTAVLGDPCPCLAAPSCTLHASVSCRDLFLPTPELRNEFSGQIPQSKIH